MSHPDGLRAAAPAAAAAGAGPTAAGAAPAAPGSLRVAIVGDVHGAWRPEREEAALRFLNPDITLLVGDFGNENVELVRQIAALPLRKAVILGNHDAWFTMKGGAAAGARRPAVQQQLSAADLLQALQRGEGVTAEQDGVRKQLAALGPEHVGYGTLALQEQGYTVVGARPFSKGGKNFSSIRPFMMSLYGVQSMEESAFRITQVANSAAEEHALIFMGHNGPAGLGSRAWDICGVDWESKAGDHGDPDLQMALGNLAACGRRVALVTFGHMHHHLSARGSHGLGHRYRRMAHIDPDTGTVFLNSATVPRVMPAPPLPTAPHDHHLDDHHSDHHKRPHGSGSNSAGSSPPTSPKAYGSGRRARMAAKAAAAAAAAAAAGVHGADDASSSGGGAEAATAHHFMFVQMEGGEVVSARDVWVQVTPVADDLEAAEVLAALTAAAAVAEVEAPAASTAAAVAAGADGNGDGGAATAAATATTSTSSSDGEATETVAVAVPPSAPQRVGDFVVHTLRQHEVVRTVAAAEPGKVVKFVWNAYDQLYEPVVLNRQAVGTNVGTGAAQAATDRVPGEDGADAAAVVVVDAAEGTKEVVAVEAH
ncbi:hypothetical protein HYH02_001462 [Chlamydomonas schloesseri]|uniref:Calcineurin-like phosphoesterase domain-containing protein n=1 Tax=Chlamydomonas schloesseri TaxID=2026947 RepID=A0A835WWG4_9CHLO|nr:hypothetical protein HYH02_001462 [Chlamydomonas schloesseri]|eukprot:KAG2454443.1 hypothetical protein HYH02_001462 [Chlamydomonas schloesseri]